LLLSSKTATRLLSIPAEDQNNVKSIRRVMGLKINYENIWISER
jgi:hypothetical protein